MEVCAVCNIEIIIKKNSLKVALVYDLCRYASQIVIDAIIFCCFFFVLIISCHKHIHYKSIEEIDEGSRRRKKRPPQQQQQQQQKISILTTATSLSITDHVSFGRRYIGLLRPRSAHCQFKICIYMCRRWNRRHENSSKHVNIDGFDRAEPDRLP